MTARIWPWLFVALLFPIAGAAGDPIVKELRHKSVAELDGIFRGGEAVAPCGKYDGAVITNCPALCPKFKSIRQSMIWKGKIFCADGTMTNRWALGVETVTVPSGPGMSGLDNGACWEIVYPKGTPVFGGTRDEIRRVGPGIYLGRATTLCGEFRGYFVLQGCE